jgi:hypothetical protein
MSDDHDRPPVLDRLGAEIERIATAGARPARRHRHRAGPFGRRALVLALLTLIVAAAAAVAATTGLLTGDPVQNPAGVGFGDPKSGLGVPVPASVKLAPLRAADPAGGLPWGARTLKTTRGYACLQIGRVQDGRIGAIGQDGAFADDGRFHELPPGVIEGIQCGPQDGAGHGFLAIAYNGLPASGLERACRSGQAGSVTLRDGTTIPPCPRADQRLVFFGLLGPQATAVTYRADDGSVATQRVSGPEGAYVVVVRPSARHPAKGSFSLGRTPGSGLLSVRYRDGSVCRIVSPIRLGGARQCPAKGYVAPRGARLTAADVATPVRATVSARPVEPHYPGLPGHQPRQWRVTVRFRARVASTDQSRFYKVSLTPDHQTLCRFGGAGGPVSHDVAAGAVVRHVIWVPARCRGELYVTVTLHQQHGAPYPMPSPMRTKGDPLVGQVTARIPRR